LLITNPTEAAEEIARLWDELSESSFRAVSFRNGEGWHNARTFAAVEGLGFAWDSTAIPGRTGITDHPMNWAGTPNHPYYPDPDDIRRSGGPRRVLEIPMNTWHLKTSYDLEPCLRYMNPAVHKELFMSALKALRIDSRTGLQIWTFILHPGEVLASRGSDQLYARSAAAVCHNLAAFAESVGIMGHGVEFVTISKAGEEWVRRETAI
jgi:hypothetical protein